LRATEKSKTVAVPEENIVCEEEDRHKGECILIHAFGGHTMKMGAPPGFFG
jgi:hypothetical protein